MPSDIERRGETALTPLEQEIANEARADVAMFQQGVARISTKGGKLTIDGTPARENKLVVGIISAVFGKAYYEQEYTPDVPQTPICYAFHPTDARVMVPHEAAPDKQSQSCAACKWNKFGTAERGAGKRCKDEIRLMVVAPSGDDFANAEVRMLSVPPGSLQNWGKYVARLADAGQTIRSVLTEVSVEPYKGAYKLAFNAVGKLPEAAYLSLKARRDTAVEQSMQPYPVLDDNEEPEETPQRAQQRRRRAAKLD